MSKFYGESEKKIRDIFGCGQVVTNHAERKELRVRGLQNLQQLEKGIAT